MRSDGRCLRKSDRTTTMLGTESTPATNRPDGDNLSRYRESPSWMEPYYVPERMKDREGHRRRIGEVIKGVEGTLGVEVEREYILPGKGEVIDHDIVQLVSVDMALSLDSTE
ncbi:hypothetical protein BDV28DRAFT_4415 [Aspergillus coremiiformis]|uniref:Uncharacterized protein n=1 Tax=Aspergillus coremiiformis TaxID=138285 RepID=A0A5N6Z3N5_9EURO|nr:hypothetical protein BDV28DRAFT_4415 [Aspergillus coremiiformis]